MKYLNGAPVSKIVLERSIHPRSKPHYQNLVKSYKIIKNVLSQKIHMDCSRLLDDGKQLARRSRWGEGQKEDAWIAGS